MFTYSLLQLIKAKILPTFAVAVVAEMNCVIYSVPPIQHVNNFVYKDMYYTINIHKIVYLLRLTVFIEKE